MDKDEQKGRLLKRYLLILGSLILAFGLIAGAVVFAYSVVTGGESGNLATEKPVEPERGSTDNTPVPPVESDKPNALEDLFRAPDRTTVMVLGLDEQGLLADVQLLATFDALTNRVDVISIPRDTYVVLPQTEVRAIQQDGRTCPNDGVMKINEVHARAGTEKGPAAAQRQMERMFGVDIDYYAVVNIKAFRAIVEEVGGVPFTVRPEGYYYNPPDQELVINIPGGYRVLSGIEAEGVVRFREGVNAYRGGDLERIEVQHQFMQAFLQTVLGEERLMSNLPALLSTMVSYVKTDFGIDSIPKYLSVLENINMDNVNFQRLPGDGKYIGVTSYFLMDETATEALIYEIFHKNNVESSSDGAADVDVSKLRVQVLNGGAADGMAGTTRDALTAKGYNVTATGNYTGTQRVQTRILVREQAHGAPFVAEFKSAAVEVDQNISALYDVVIILGKGE